MEQSEKYIMKALIWIRDKPKDKLWSNIFTAGTLFIVYNMTYTLLNGSILGMLGNVLTLIAFIRCEMQCKGSSYLTVLSKLTNQ